MAPPIGRRALQAQQTRAEIIRSARARFATDGYAATSVKDVAATAGVSVQTVYDSVGTKAALVLALNDELAADAGIPTLVDAAFGAESPDALVELPGQIARAILDHAGDIVRIIIGAAADEPDVRRVLDDAHRRQLTGARELGERLAAHGALRAGLSTADAVDTLTALGDTGLALTLHEDYGWTTERIQAWITASLRRLLLD